ncbi:hypothetical protein [Caballeronia sordidicola]|uniref:Uncharacterized protein n=1 Tax=Caballeronia sordidicola TaxID=196367 RepID=A0A226X3M0_CABSO|nr:hypothetical protein [Caballeronia sordidicola]OXC78024.1 hypothetical protein BSU04_13945 [Caballeronia sordidicola]
MPTISFRVTDSQKIELEARSDGNVSDYVKSVLFDQQATLNQILQRLPSAQSVQPQDTRSAFDHTNPNIENILAEVLMLLRFTVKPDSKRSVHAELNRLGLPLWHPEADKS